MQPGHALPTWTTLHAGLGLLHAKAHFHVNFMWGAGHWESHFTWGVFRWGVSSPLESEDTTTGAYNYVYHFFIISIAKWRYICTFSLATTLSACLKSLRVLWAKKSSSLSTLDVCKKNQNHDFVCRGTSIIIICLSSPPPKHTKENPGHLAYTRWLPRWQNIFTAEVPFSLAGGDRGTRKALYIVLVWQ